MSDEPEKKSDERKTPKLRVHLDLEGENPDDIKRHLERMAGRKRGRKGMIRNLKRGNRRRASR